MVIETDASLSGDGELANVGGPYSNSGTMSGDSKLKLMLEIGFHGFIMYNRNGLWVLG